MTIQIEDSTITSGAAGVVFDNDGGSLTVESIEVSDISSAALLATANAGTSFLQETKITASSLNSVTFTTAGGSQVVLNVEVSDMDTLEDAFFVEGVGSTLSVVGTSVNRNQIADLSAWSIVSAQSQAIATITDSSFSENRGVEFCVSATLGATITVKDSDISENRGVVSTIMIYASSIICLLYRFLMLLITSFSRIP
jgi:hypothetical protein